MVRCSPLSRDQHDEQMSKRSIDDSKPTYLTDASKEAAIKTTYSDLNEEEINDQQPEQNIELIVEDTSVDETDAVEDRGADLVPAASSIVFRPLFVYRYQQIKRRRRPRSADEVLASTDEEIRRNKRDTDSTKQNVGVAGSQKIGEEVSIERFRERTNDGEMEVAESAIVFRPVFRYKRRYTQRRRRN